MWELCILWRHKEIIMNYPHNKPTFASSPPTISDTERIHLLIFLTPSGSPGMREWTTTLSYIFSAYSLHSGKMYLHNFNWFISVLAVHSLGMTNEWPFRLFGEFLSFQLIILLNSLFSLFALIRVCDFTVVISTTAWGQQTDFSARSQIVGGFCRILPCL